MEKIKKVVSGMDALSEWSGRIFSWFIVGIVLLSLFEVFTRRILGEPTIWTFEILGYFFCGSILLTMGYTLKYKQHVSIDLFYSKFSSKTKAVLNIITYVIFLGFFTIVLLWKGIIFAGTSWSMMEKTPSAFNFYIFPAKTLLPLGAFFLLIQVISDLTKDIVFLVKGERL